MTTESEREELKALRARLEVLESRSTAPPAKVKPPGNSPLAVLGALAAAVVFMAAAYMLAPDAEGDSAPTSASGMGATKRLSYCAAGLVKAGHMDRRLRGASYKIGNDPTVLALTPVETFSCPASSSRGDIVIAVAATCGDVLEARCVEVRSAYLNGRAIDLR